MTKPSYDLESARRDAELASEEGRRIQQRAERASQSAVGETKSAMQAGLREYPDKLPRQHTQKHAAEADLALAPMYEAPYYKGSNKLAGKVALITGGSSGIGRAVAVLFAREGADVVICYLANHDDAEVTKRAVEAEGRRCILLSGDIARAEFCEMAVSATLESFGGLDIVVSNAAFQQHGYDITNLSDEQFERTLRTNLHGAFYLSRSAIPHIRPGGCILLTGSLVGIRGSKELLDYAMTKGGLHAFARSLAAQLIDRNIRVNVVAPGPVWTPLNPADRPADEIESFGQNVPMRRAAQPEEIAPAFVYLASPATASYVTGEILPVVGGWGH